MGVCRICGKTSPLISSFLSTCYECIVKNKHLRKFFLEKHAEKRRMFDLPEKIPKVRKWVKCEGCGNECRIPENGRGFCGLVKNEGGVLKRIAGTPEKGLLNYYYDPHPTNCVASWICAATGKGYPKFSYSKGVEYGFYNLAVFYGACNFDCIFCQNWFYRDLLGIQSFVSARELADKAGKKVSCICFFGGDPGPQIIHAIETARMALEKKKGEILRICLETNGNLNSKLLKKFAELSFNSGGTIKFDLKCFDENLSYALSGVSNKKIWKNFEMLVELHGERKEVPFLHASTLLIPGYVEVEEVEKIARFLAELDANIPYSLLAFYPSFLMTDLPTTSRKVALECLRKCKDAGLKCVRIGNVHLLS